MTSLMDALKQGMTGEQPKPELGETGQVQRLLAAKKGKAATPTTGPRQSAIAERMAARQTELAGQQ